VTSHKPIDVPTNHTADFLAAQVPRGGQILEVGCGKGHVAAELSRRGYNVLGLDSNPEAVLAARENGANAVVASWPDYNGPAVDAVAFTRSLHHITPLDRAVRKAQDVLRPHGSLLIEDFAFEEMNAATMHWFIDVVRSERATLLIRPVEGEFVTNLLRARDPLEAWRAGRPPGLHSMTAMTLAVQERVAIRAIHLVPYLYRYLVRVLDETAEAAAFVEGVFQDEARFGQRGDIVTIGCRIVA
jgi:SAM-dependent methyltransferase